MNKEVDHEKLGKFLFNFYYAQFRLSPETILYFIIFLRFVYVTIQYIFFESNNRTN